MILGSPEKTTNDFCKPLKNHSAHSAETFLHEHAKGRGIVAPAPFPRGTDKEDDADAQGKTGFRLRVGVCFSGWIVKYN